MQMRSGGCLWPIRQFKPQQQLVCWFIIMFISRVRPWEFHLIFLVNGELMEETVLLTQGGGFWSLKLSVHAWPPECFCSYTGRRLEICWSNVA